MSVSSKPTPMQHYGPSKSSAKPGEFSGKLSGVVPMPPQRAALLQQARQMSPQQWMKLMHALFRSPEEVSLFFGCDEKTGRNYWNGVGRPTLDRALVAQVVYPAQFRQHMIDGIVER